MVDSCGGSPVHPATPIDSVPLAVVDVETTGLDPWSGHRVCEVAVLRADPDGSSRVFSSLVNPDRRIDPGASAVNGLYDEDVCDASSFASLIPMLDDHIAGAVLVAHNAPFDVDFLSAEYMLASIPPPEVPILDTLALARMHFRFQRNHLGALARAFGVSTGGGHRAEADVWTTYRVFRRMTEELARRDYLTLGDFLRAQGRPTTFRTRRP
jgi:ATP-dependent helicase Lhr and Lhr-like helicase